MLKESQGSMGPCQWFSAQVGSTVWLAAAGASAWGADNLAGLVFVAGFALSNLWGWFIWRLRLRWSPRVGLLAMLGGVAFANAAVVLILEQQDSVYGLPFWVLLAVPAMMAWIWVLSRPKVVAAQLDNAADDVAHRS